VIQGYAEALQNDALGNKERTEYAKAIVGATKKLAALVTNILKLNKLENQEILPTRTRFNLGEQIRLCALGFEDLWERKNIGFTADLEDTMVWYDEDMLKIVWNNLISNAVKFTNPGGLITMSLKGAGDFVIITITDTGCGMDAENQKHIFDKFYQGDTSHSGEGNGLGLALVKRVIEIAGGEIAVESQAGKGTSFTVRLSI
jgi:signal transduction histidine kinase